MWVFKGGLNNFDGFVKKISMQFQIGDFRI